MGDLPRVVILTGSSVPHRYVAQALCALPNVVAIVSVEQPKTPFLKRLAGTRRRFGLFGMVYRVLLKLALRLTGAEARRERDLRRVLGDPTFPAGVQLIHSIGVNSIQTRQLLRDLKPDILCVYGTYLVNDATLGIARQVALNLHTGISPRYRGADCYFWPIYEGEPEWVGATVHVCSAAVDGGAIYDTARASLDPKDGIGAVFGRSVAVGAELYRRVVHDLSHGQANDPVPQDVTLGKEYRVADRGWSAEVRVWRLLRAGLRDS
jgi:methionyl-tRNA formyltransferase